MIRRSGTRSIIAPSHGAIEDATTEITVMVSISTIRLGPNSCISGTAMIP